MKLGFTLGSIAFLIFIGLVMIPFMFGEKVEVPPAHVGMVLTKHGYKPDPVPPSKFRLDPCLTYCDKLILVELSDKGIKESFALFMPKDQLNMSFDVRLTLSIKENKDTTKSIVNRVVAKENLIDFDTVYITYGQPIIRDISRSIIAKYSINEVASSREAVNEELSKALHEALARTPLTVKKAALADIQFPEVITRQKEVAAERRIAIEQEEANKQIALVKLQTELEQAKARRAIRREKAEAALEENRIFSESVTEKYLAYKKLEVLEAMANNPNVVFMPFSALDEVGASQRMFTTLPKSDKMIQE